MIIITGTYKYMLSLRRNWPKEAMSRPIGAGIVDGAKLFKNVS